MIIVCNLMIIIILIFTFTVTVFNLLRTGNPTIATLANSEDPDDNAAFHQGLRCLL